MVGGDYVAGTRCEHGFAAEVARLLGEEHILDLAFSTHQLLCRKSPPERRSERVRTV